MITVLLRAAPCPAIAGIAGASLLAGVGALLLPGPGLGPFILTVALALLAAASAFALDEAAAEIVDVTPLGRPRWTAARAVALAVPCGAGLILVLTAAGRDDGWPIGGIGLAVVGNVLLGFAVASVVRRRVGEPGPAVASAVALVLVTVSLVRTLGRHIAIANGDSSAALWWAVVASVSAVVVVVAVRTNRFGRWSASRPAHSRDA